MIPRPRRRTRPVPAHRVPQHRALLRIVTVRMIATASAAYLLLALVAARFTDPALVQRGLNATSVVIWTLIAVVVLGEAIAACTAIEDRLRRRKDRSAGRSAGRSATPPAVPLHGPDPSPHRASAA